MSANGSIADDNPLPLTSPGASLRPSLEIGRQASYIESMYMQFSANKFPLPARFSGPALLLGLLLPC